MPLGCRLSIGGCSSHVEPRPYTEGEGALALQGLSKVREPITSNAARCAREASLRVTPPPERQPAEWRLFACHANAGCALEATAHTSHHGLAPKERGLPPVTCHSIIHRPITTSAAKRSRGKLACFATSRETASAVLPVRVPRECRARIGSLSLHIAPRPCTEKERPSAGAVPFHSAQVNHNQRGTARPRGKLECFATS